MKQKMFSMECVSTFDWGDLDNMTLCIRVIDGYVFGWDPIGGVQFLLREPGKRKNTVKGNRTPAGSRGSKK